MTLLVIIGTITTLIGVAGFAHCIRVAARMRGAEITPEERTERLRGLVVVNMASVFVAFIGLAMVVIGLIL
ncbi:hypothetical protein [Roseobacter sp. HKCCA0434]|uniref:hypothetical protein n=1 Tax=Roseobacter sp. HKCCA0434 TaxID=3079297 RepID=UPI002905C6A5|nr:hypothetical protein [Roseobacter sp. HKCCA0434]